MTTLAIFAVLMTFSYFDAVINPVNYNEKQVDRIEVIETEDETLVIASD